MKITVITNYDQKNYGSVLQAFALQSKLHELGAENYILKWKKDEKKKSPIKKVRDFLAPSQNQYSMKAKLEIRKAKKHFAKRYQKMAKFCQQNIAVKYCDSLQSASLMVGDRDVLLAGSDQIWSTAGHQLSPFTTLQFGTPYMHRFSYAASVGTAQLNDEARQLLTEGLRNFDEISVRESSSVELIRTVTDRPITWHIDPTLLYDRSFWEKTECPPKTPSGGYIFLYIIRPEPIALTAAKQLSARTGLPVKAISNRILEGDNLENITSAGIEEFLELIHHADYVVTNSFHGTAFAVQYHKPFCSVAVSGSGMRVKDFLSNMALSDRIISSPEDVERIDETIDWDNAEKYLCSAREKAIGYLKKIVSTDTAIPFNKQKTCLYRDKTECCGCGACMNICPTDAISMVYDKDGFMYPEVHEEKCIHCGKCKKACHYQNGHCSNEILDAYGAVSTNDTLLMGSSSGGLFASLALAVLEKDGVVFGCAMQKKENGLTPVHMAIHSKEELPLLQSSKYAQSDTGYIYREVKKYLTEGKYVLFSGTPCQVDGLKGYLGNRPYENLFTIDLVCHGVPSASLLQDYLKLEEKKKNITITAINFRDKRFGWGVRGTIYGNDKHNKHKEIYFDNFSSSFYNLYLINIFYRSNCYSCRYTGTHRPGDITAGDFWGIDKQHSEWLENWSKNKGISCVLVNSQQGKKLLETFGKYLDLKKTVPDKIIAQNKPIIRPSVPTLKREKILNLYEQSGYEAVDKWFWKKNGKKLFIYGKWDKIPEERRKKLKKITKIIKR